MFGDVNRWMWTDLETHSIYSQVTARFELLQASNRLPSTVRGAVETGIAAGFRHIDTAYRYQNEADVGKALKSKMKQGVIKRRDMFIVSKVGANGYFYPGDLETTCDPHLRWSIKCLGDVLLL